MHPLLMAVIEVMAYASMAMLFAPFYLGIVLSFLERHGFIRVNHEELERAMRKIICYR